MVKVSCFFDRSIKTLFNVMGNCLEHNGFSEFQFLAIYFRAKQLQLLILVLDCKLESIEYFSFLKKCVPCEKESVWLSRCGIGMKKEISFNSMRKACILQKSLRSNIQWSFVTKWISKERKKKNFILVYL